MTLELFALTGIPEVRPGDDLPRLIAEAAAGPGGPGLVDGDVLVVTSKVVSKAEGRLASSANRDAVIDQETKRVVSSWVGPQGRTVIAETRHGFVLAAAGVDESNTNPGTLVLLPTDPDDSAARLRHAIREMLGVTIAAVVTDTMGRPWRQGQTDTAIGAAGLTVLLDHVGSPDGYGNTLRVTLRAVADEIAAAADLVAGKTDGVPAVVVRGLASLVLPADDDGPGAQALVRPSHQDRFRMGTAEAMRAAVVQRRTVRAFSADPVPRHLVLQALGAALSAPSPHHATPWRFVLVEDTDARGRLLAAMRQQWQGDLRSDGLPEAAITHRVQRGDVLHEAPVLIIPCVVHEGAHEYPDRRRREAEATMYWLAAGAGIQNVLIALAAEGLGSAWMSSTLFCPDLVRRELGLAAGWQPAGALAIGYPAEPAGPRPQRDLADLLHVLA